MTWTASSRVQPWLASSRMATSGPTASRTAATRCTSVLASVPTFIFRVRKPVGHPRAGGVGEGVSRTCRQGDVGRQHVAYAVRPGREDRGDRGALRLGDEVVQGRVDRGLGTEVAGHGALDDGCRGREVVPVVERAGR